LEQRLENLKKNRANVIVGVETGSVPGRLGAVVVEVSGNGSGTVLDLHSFQSVELPGELVAALESLKNTQGVGGREQAEVNFLILHNINTLFFDLLEASGITPGEVDLIGLKGLEIGGVEFPEDPGALSEMTGCVVAACFRIGQEKGGGHWLPVKEAILKGMVEAMVEKYGLDEEVREAVAVALLANESVYHEALEPGDPSSRSITVQRVGDGGAALHGEFFFPAD
jgi:hypothetical protein